MAHIQLNYFSEALKKITTVQIMVPTDAPKEMVALNPHFQRPAKILYLLHGFSGSSQDWMLSGMAQNVSGLYNLVIVMPTGDNSFYLNGKGTGRAYQTFAGEELVKYVEGLLGLQIQQEDRFIGGLSMGGFGALHTALAYPDTFGKAFGLSSALVIHDVKNMVPGTTDVIADYDYYVSTFGELTDLEESENNPEVLVRKLKRTGRKIPPFYMACGTEDFLIAQNRAFRDFLENEGADLTYLEDAGIHDWNYWNAHLEPAVEWALKKTEKF